MSWYISEFPSLFPFLIAAAPVVTSLRRTPSSSQFTLICSSTTSPATTVVWTKDGTNLTADGTLYQSSQVVTDRSSSTYDNILTSTEIIEGNYTCTVSNLFGSSSRSVEIKGTLESIVLLQHYYVYSSSECPYLTVVNDTM